MTKTDPQKLAWMRDYYARTRATRLDKNREWRRSHPEYERQRERVWATPEYRAYKSEYRLRNIEKVRAASNRSYAKLGKKSTPEQKTRKSEYGKRYYKEVGKNRRDQRREQIKVVQKRWKERNPERVRMLNSVHMATRAALLYSIRGSFTVDQFAVLIKRFKGRCAYCGEVRKLEADHRIPISRKELDPTNGIRNILPACRSCNSQKHNKTEAEYRAILRERANRI